VGETRKPWDVLFIEMAQLLAEGRGTCERLRVGCLVTTADHQQILSLGFNGNYAGGPNVCDDPTAVGNCQCIHAEDNALLKCDNRIKDKVIYVTHSPCVVCAKRIINAGASRVVYGMDYRSSTGAELLRSVGIPCELVAA
jgi:dCMP deaminase